MGYIDEKRHWIIYMYTFPNGKRYIGKTCQSLGSRQGDNWKGYQNCTLLWNAIQKYGIENIQQNILIERDMTNEEAARFEQIFIMMFKTNVNRFNTPKYGYNLTDGGEGLSGWHPTGEDLERRLKQMEEFKRNRIGKPLSEESRQKMRMAKLGKKRGNLSDETKKKISIANSRENMSYETHIRRSNSKKKKVIVINNETLEEKIYNSQEEVAKEFGVAQSIVSRWINGNRTPSINYTFQRYSPTTTE